MKCIMLTLVILPFFANSSSGFRLFLVKNGLLKTRGRLRICELLTLYYLAIMSISARWTYLPDPSPPAWLVGIMRPNKNASETKEEWLTLKNWIKTPNKTRVRSVEIRPPSLEIRLFFRNWALRAFASKRSRHTVQEKGDENWQMLRRI